MGNLIPDRAKYRLLLRRNQARGCQFPVANDGSTRNPPGPGMSKQVNNSWCSDLSSGAANRFDELAIRLWSSSCVVSHPSIGNLVGSNYLRMVDCKQQNSGDITTDGDEPSRLHRTAPGRFRSAGGCSTFRTSFRKATGRKGNTSHLPAGQVSGRPGASPRFSAGRFSRLFARICGRNWMRKSLERL